MSGKHHRVSPLGKILSRIPQDKKWLFPFYQAGQLSFAPHTYTSADLPQALDGFTIAYASDIHYGPMFSKERALKLVEKINALQADLILLGGDFGEITKTSIDFFQAIPAFTATYGVYAATGNHDLNGTQAEFDALLQTMQAKNVHMLRNASTTIQKGTACLRLCATDDTRHGQPAPEILFDPTSEVSSCFTLFFPHSPDILPDLLSQEKKAFDLAICGHTHGGQIALWGHSLHSSSIYGDRYRSGWYQEHGHDIFVSNGVGTSLIPVRIGAPAQYHLFTLRIKNS